MQGEMLDEIYEAALVPELWPHVLEKVGRRVRAKGGILFTESNRDFRWLGSSEVGHVMLELLAGGWMAHNTRASIVVARAFPGFVTELDYMTERETRELPIFKEFLRPRGYFATAGSYVNGLSGDHIMLSFEGFENHQAAHTAIPELNEVRPHLARAVQVAAQFQLQRMRGQLEALQAIGAAACVVSGKGCLQVFNQRFEAELGTTFNDRRARLTISDGRADVLMAEALGAIAAGHRTGRSILVRTPNAPSRLLHVIPISGQAHDLFIAASSILVLANANSAAKISPQIVQEIFDITPAEAKVAAAVCNGSKTLRDVANELGVTVNTVKTQLQAVFDKTGTNRQIDLARLLMAARRDE